MSNTSGINPIGIRIVVKCEKMEEKTPGGIILPEAMRDRENAAGQKAMLIAKGDDAGDFTDYAFPEVGSRVLIKKFAGVEVKGADGEEYRVCEDKDVLAILEG